MLRVGSTVIGVSNIPRAVEFWAAALNYLPREAPDETWVVLIPREGHGAQIALNSSESPIQEHPRLHIDLYADDQLAEVERLIALGATRVEWDMYPADPDFVVLADPDGNRFCVVEM